MSPEDFDRLQDEAATIYGDLYRQSYQANSGTEAVNLQTEADAYLRGFLVLFQKQKGFLKAKFCDLCEDKSQVPEPDPSWTVHRRGRTFQSESESK